MKLFLSSTSNALSLLWKILPRKGKGTKVLFSENAADNIPGNHFWVKNDRRAFIKLGCEVVDADLRELSRTDFIRLMNNSNIIHFCGGSVMYLMSLLVSKGLGSIIAKRVQQGKIIFTGTSAGSMIAADSLKLITFDPDEKIYTKKMKSSNGLGLVDFLLMPHCNQKEFVDYVKSLIVHLPKNSQPLVLISDDQAVRVTDNKFEILSC